MSFTYKPFENTTFHAGYARYFTPPVLVEAAPANIALVQQHHRRGRMPASANNPVLPERSHYFDAGVDQKIPFGCYGDGVAATAPASKSASMPTTRSRKDLIDNGQFGQALVLNAFNYQQGINEGIELSAKYTNGRLSRPTPIWRWRSRGRPTWCRTNICSTIPHRSPISAA